MKKSSLIRVPDGGGDKGYEDLRITNTLVKKHLAAKYELSSDADITIFSLREENSSFQRGIYKIRTFGQGEIVVKILRKDRDSAAKYYEDIKNTHLAWQQDSALGQYILKARLKSKKPDYNDQLGLLFMEFEKARGTLAQKISKGDKYTEEERTRDYTELVKAVTFLHRRGEETGRNFHGDLKPDNIFFVDHQNADGLYVECLKIGDIEETLGTLPYRDSSNISRQAWEKNKLPLPGKDDDSMALKMVFLEMAYDFCLFDFCAELLNQGIQHLNSFLSRNAAERKELIEKNGKRQKYFKTR